MDVLCCVTFHPLFKLSDYTAVDTALSTTLTMGMLAVGLGASQVLFSPDHQHRSTEVWSQDCNNHGSAPTVVAVGAAQTDWAQPPSV